MVFSLFLSALYLLLPGALDHFSHPNICVYRLPKHCHVMRGILIASILLICELKIFILNWLIHNHSGFFSINIGFTYIAKPLVRRRTSTAAPTTISARLSPPVASFLRMLFGAETGLGAAGSVCASVGFQRMVCARSGAGAGRGSCVDVMMIVLTTLLLISVLVRVMRSVAISSSGRLSIRARPSTGMPLTNRLAAARPAAKTLLGEVRSGKRRTGGGAAGGGLCAAWRGASWIYHT